MASQEVLVAQLGAQSFDERGEIIGNVADNRLHPQVNGGTGEKVQSKSLIISMLHLIQRQWARKDSEKPQIRRFCSGHAASDLLGSAPCSEIATIVRPRWMAYPPWGKGVIAQRPIIIAPCMPVPFNGSSNGKKELWPASSSSNSCSFWWEGACSRSRGSSGSWLG